MASQEGAKESWLFGLGYRQEYFCQAMRAFLTGKPVDVKSGKYLRPHVRLGY
jgi:hypothetical protein